MDDQRLFKAVAVAVATSRPGSNETPEFDALARFVRARVGPPAESGPAEDRIAAIYNGLLSASVHDPEVVPALTRLWAAVDAGPSTSPGAVTNTNTGTVHGTVVQARDIHGGITFGRAGHDR